MPLFRRKKEKKDKIHMPTINILVSSVNSAELTSAKFIDSETIEYNKQELYNGTKPIPISIDMLTISRNPIERILGVLIFGRRRICETYFVLKGEPFTRRLYTGNPELSELIDSEKKEQILAKYDIDTTREIVDSSDIDFITQEAYEFKNSGIIKEYWRSAKGRTIKDWLPWIIIAITAIAGFIALLVMTFMFLQM